MHLLTSNFKRIHEWNLKHVSHNNEKPLSITLGQVHHSQLRRQIQSCWMTLSSAILKLNLPNLPPFTLGLCNQVFRHSLVLSRFSPILLYKCQFWAGPSSLVSSRLLPPFLQGSIAEQKSLISFLSPSPSCTIHSYMNRDWKWGTHKVYKEVWWRHEVWRHEVCYMGRFVRTLLCNDILFLFLRMHRSLEPPIGQGLICSQETKSTALLYEASRFQKCLWEP